MYVELVDEQKRKVDNLVTFYREVDNLVTFYREVDNLVTMELKISRRMPPTPVAAPWKGSMAEGWLWLSILKARR